MTLLALTLSTKTPTIPYTEISIARTILVMFMALQIYFAVYCILRVHRDKLILLFVNSQIVASSAIYFTLTGAFAQLFSFQVIICAFELAILFLTKSSEEKKEKYKPKKQIINWVLFAWVVCLALIIYGLFARDIHWYLSAHF